MLLGTVEVPGRAGLRAAADAEAPETIFDLGGLAVAGAIR
jgi:hypothetical protein